MGKNFAGPSIEKTKELSNLFVVFETYFSNLLITNLEKTPLKNRKKTNITRATIISEILIPDIPSFQTSINRSLKFSNTFIKYFPLVEITHLQD